jgi:hypothetical protein
MYILNATSRNGVYAVNNRSNKKRTVLIWEDSDDAERYKDLLDANGFDDELEVTEVDEEMIIRNCEAFNYDYSIIDKNNFVVPLNYDHL